MLYDEIFKEIQKYYLVGYDKKDIIYQEYSGQYLLDEMTSKKFESGFYREYWLPFKASLKGKYPNFELEDATMLDDR